MEDLIISQLKQIFGSAKLVRPLFAGQAGQSPQRFSQNFLFECQGFGLIVAKIIRPKVDAQTNPITVASSLASAIRRFYEGLKERGMLVPELFELKLLEEQGLILNLASYLGDDLMTVLNHSPERAPELLFQFIGCLQLVLDNLESPVGLDGHLGNFCPTEQGLAYNDFNPPYLRASNHYQLGWPQPETAGMQQALIYRHFTLIGALRASRLLLEHLNSELPNVLLDQLEIRRLIAEKSQMLSLPVYWVAELVGQGRRKLARKMVESLEPGQVYDLQELALRYLTWEDFKEWFRKIAPRFRPEKERRKNFLALRRLISEKLKIQQQARKEDNGR